MTVFAPGQVKYLFDSSVIVLFTCIFSMSLAFRLPRPILSFLSYSTSPPVPPFAIILHLVLLRKEYPTIEAPNALLPHPSRRSSKLSARAVQDFNFDNQLKSRPGPRRTLQYRACGSIMTAVVVPSSSFASIVALGSVLESGPEVDPR